MFTFFVEIFISKSRQSLDVVTYECKCSISNCMASGINIYSVFWVSKIIISDIQNNYSGYPKSVFWKSKIKLVKYFILDIQNNILDIQNETFI